MSAVLLAVFTDYATADRVRTDLVQDGFPTDRVDVTALCDPGRSALLPCLSRHEQLVKYFRSLLTRDDEQGYPELFAQRVEEGAATVTVHPRGVVEVERASEVLDHAGAAEVARHELADQAFEHAAARSARPWVRYLWAESPTPDLCIYCRLFEHGPVKPHTPDEHKAERQLRFRDDLA